MKKLEIIIEAIEKKRVRKILEELKVSGYTIIDEVQGRGKTAARSASDLSNIMKNSLFIIVENEEMIQKIIERVKNEVLAFYSGKIFLSDIQVIN